MKIIKILKKWTSIDNQRIQNNPLKESSLRAKSS